MALLPPAIGLAVLAAGKRSRALVSVGRRYTLPAYLSLLAGMLAFTFVLGNKNEVLAALVAGVLAYLGLVRKPNWSGSEWLWPADCGCSTPSTSSGRCRWRTWGTR